MRYRRTPLFPKILLITVLLAAVIGVIWGVCTFAEKRAAMERYASVVTAYNASADEYRELFEITSVDNIVGMPSVPEPHTISDGMEAEEIGRETDRIRREWEELRYALRLARQITEPSAEWVTEHLGMVEGITEAAAVTDDRDPNGMLGKDGGYTACVYFTVSDIEQDTIPGADAIAKGTDGGGAVEVYRTAADALARYEYLAQFDNTLLYTGSCAVVGTMVIRTSYALTDEEQLLLTDRITRAFVKA